MSRRLTISSLLNEDERHDQDVAAAPPPPSSSSSSVTGLDALVHAASQLPSISTPYEPQSQPSQAKKRRHSDDGPVPGPHTLMMGPGVPPPPPPSARAARTVNPYPESRMLIDQYPPPPRPDVRGSPVFPRPVQERILSPANERTHDHAHRFAGPSPSPRDFVSPKMSARDFRDHPDAAPRDRRESIPPHLPREHQFLPSGRDVVIGPRDGRDPILSPNMAAASRDPLREQLAQQQSPGMSPFAQYSSRQSPSPFPQFSQPLIGPGTSTEPPPPFMRHSPSPFSREPVPPLQQRDTASPFSSRDSHSPFPRDPHSRPNPPQRERHGSMSSQHEVSSPRQPIYTSPTLGRPQYRAPEMQMSPFIFEYTSTSRPRSAQSMNISPPAAPPINLPPLERQNSDSPRAGYFDQTRDQHYSAPPPPPRRLSSPDHTIHPQRSPPVAVHPNPHPHPHSQPPLISAPSPFVEMPMSMPPPPRSAPTKRSPPGSQEGRAHAHRNHNPVEMLDRERERERADKDKDKDKEVKLEGATPIVLSPGAAVWSKPPPAQDDMGMGMDVDQTPSEPHPSLATMSTEEPKPKKARAKPREKTAKEKAPPKRKPAAGAKPKKEDKERERDDAHEWLLEHFADSPASASNNSASASVSNASVAAPVSNKEKDMGMGMDVDVDAELEETLLSRAPTPGVSVPVPMEVDVDNELLNLIAPTTVPSPSPGPGPGPHTHPTHQHQHQHPSTSLSSSSFPTTTNSFSQSQPQSQPGPSSTTFPSTSSSSGPSLMPMVLAPPMRKAAMKKSQDRESMPPPAPVVKKRAAPKAGGATRGRKPAGTGEKKGGGAAGSGSGSGAGEKKGKAKAAERSRSTSVLPEKEKEKEKEKEVGGVGGPEEEDKDKGEEKVEDDRLYCVCRAKYDQDDTMIGCDRCDEWYHPACVGMADTGAALDLVDQFVCPACVEKYPDLNLKTTYKARCLNGLEDPDRANACPRPARGAVSKYCSAECGVKNVRRRIETFAAKGGRTDVLWDKVKDAERREGVVVRLGPGSQHPHTKNQSQSQTTSKSKREREEERLRVQLEGVARQREEVKRSMDVAVWRERLLELAVGRAQERGDECGWDQRLCFGEEEWEEFGEAVLEGYDGVKGTEGREEEWWCPEPVRCERHDGWQEIRQKDLMHEKEKQEEALIKLTTREREIRKLIEDLNLKYGYAHSHGHEDPAPLKVNPKVVNGAAGGGGGGGGGGGKRNGKGAGTGTGRKRK